MNDQLENLIGTKTIIQLPACQGILIRNHSPYVFPDPDFGIPINYDYEKLMRCSIDKMDEYASLNLQKSF